VHAKAADFNAGDTARPFFNVTRILIVEDSFETVMLLRAQLADLALSLDFAVNGQEALEKRLQTDYDLILMDMQMPVMDGYTATREIRAWEKAHGKVRVPIVAQTAHAYAASMNAGCDGHLTKPIERQDLLKAITEFASVHTLEPFVEPVRAAEAISPGILARRPAFLANRRRDLNNLEAALAARDFNVIRTIAHNCKGTGTGYGFPEISRIGAEIGSGARTSDTAKIRESLADLERFLSLAAV
jgi:CheY-like chemotaxis protein